MENIPKLITKQNIIKNFKNEKQYHNWIYNKLKSNIIKKVRSNLYALVDISTKEIYSSRFEIASNISDSSFLCYHSALEYYGIANQVYNVVYVGSLTRFNNFEFEDNEYICQKVSDVKFVNNIINEGIRVTSLEKTIVDCIDKIDIAGGIEEVLNALEQTKYLNEEKILGILQYKNKIFLYQKLGFFIELYNEQLDFSENFFKVCKSKIKNKINYLLSEDAKNIEFDCKWKLMVPKNLKSRINGGM